MSQGSAVLSSIEDETRALLDRVERLKPFVLQVPMLLAAGPSFDAQVAIEDSLNHGRRALGQRIRDFLAWMRGPAGRSAKPADVQKRFVYLRLRFNVVLAHLDIFNEAMTQRSEAENGIWLSGLEEVARDALSLPGLFEAPPVLCYLARGPGGAIRRARTRLPGGGDNPVALIRLPRERMVGSGVASSLIHEVGHQGAALLDLVTTLRADIDKRARSASPGVRASWQRWSRWISEIVADFWAVARVGVTSTAGLVGVVSLPRAFVFRDNADDPHPTPWLRVKLSCAIGRALYPHPQWRRLALCWEELYPLDGLTTERRGQLAQLEASIPELIQLLVSHRSPALQGRTLGDALRSDDRRPHQLAALWSRWRRVPKSMYGARPSLVFAVVGQARADRRVSPEAEGRILATFLSDQAMRSTLDRAAICSNPSHHTLPRPVAPVKSLHAVR